MPAYKFRAVNKNEVIINGVLVANDENHLDHRLTRADLQLINATLVSNSWLKPKKVPLRDLLATFIQFERMYAAGIPLLKILKNACDNTAESNLLNILIALHQDVSDGSKLSEAMEKHPETFNNLCTAIIGASEETGKMQDAFLYLIQYLKWTDKMQSRIKKATRGPMLLLGIVLIAVVVMMGVVVPQITQFIVNVNSASGLPLATKSLIATSDLFKNYWFLVLGIPLLIVFGIVTSRKVLDEARYHTDKIFLKMPLAGNLIRKINLSRFTQITAALYMAQIPLLNALASAEKTVNNLVLKQSINSVIKDVEGGESLSNAFYKTGEFPPLVVQMIAVGEESGNISPLLEEVSEFYNADVDETIDSMIAMIEPTLTGVLGGLILWIAVGVFGPIYGMFGDLDL